MEERLGRGGGGGKSWMAEEEEDREGVEKRSMEGRQHIDPVAAAATWGWLRGRVARD